jgi:putative Mg2+ transporter-C (MgtC) family protein
LSKHYGVQIKLKPESVPIVLAALQERSVKFAFRSLKNSQAGDKTSELFLVLTLRPGMPINDIGADLCRIEGVKSLAVK